MKVLKYGEGYPKTIVCDECKSTLEYDIEDTKDKFARISQPDPLIEYVDCVEKYLVCPVCNHHIVLDYLDFSAKFKGKSKKKKWWQK